ncbi:unnamed protein product [Oikopleura dioica]|uniref:Eukaryotic translation initiation factor 3 subunit K n=1 Tax=Oikopleura dioica TaxID=34765 RepID=E4XE94_OIKDI|nr:unnamed protein product [Oikopleura dioica]
MTAEMSAPFDPKSIHDRLKDMNRYNPENQPILEEYVLQQVREGEYDLDANMALLKLYQFYPNSIRHEIVLYVLLKGMMVLPEPDFVMYKALLSNLNDEDMDQSVRRSLEIHKLLEQCNYPKFWEALQIEHDMIAEFAGFEDAIRNHICGVITHSFQRLSRDLVKEFLGIQKEQDLNLWIERFGWKAEQNVIFVTSQEDKVKSKSIVEKVDLSGLVSVMRLGARKLGK